MKNFKKIIAVSLSLAVMCVNPVSVSAEEIVTTTSMPYDDIDMPTVFSGVTADFSDGSAIDFKYCIGEFDIFNISVKNVPENLGYAHGYFNFDVTVDDTVYNQISRIRKNLVSSMFFRHFRQILLKLWQISTVSNLI